MRISTLLVFIILQIGLVSAQSFRFAHVTDTHIGGSTATDDLIRTVDDINRQADIDFVILSGDITEFGCDQELLEAKEIISKLNKPFYVLPGNHDSKWSESGNNSFVRIFGAEGFSFEKNGYLFIGTASGPNMRMAPGLVPREQMVFLDSILGHIKNPEQPIIFVNHYPLDESLSNWYEVIDLLKTRNIQVSLLGHGHSNKLFNFEGIPGVMGRSNLRAKNEIGGYNFATVTADTLFYAERTPGAKTNPVWCKVPLGKRFFKNDTIIWPRPDFSVNSKYPQVKVKWQFQEKSDIGTGITSSGKKAVYANTKGEIVALNKTSGKTCWRFQTSGKIYSTPAIGENRVVCASTDKNIYCLNLKIGKPEWKFKTNKPIVASPVIDRKTVYVGSSEGIFRAIDLLTGKLVWQFDGVKNFVESKPLVYAGKVYFGSWGNAFYALDQQTGRLIWKREKYANRMLSPAAVWPVAANGKIFIVAPDRRMTALDAKTGAEIWDSGKYSCRESIGISGDGKLVYIKNMEEGHVLAFETGSKEQKLVWDCQADLGYEIGPSPIAENGDLVFVPTCNGLIVAISKQFHQMVWRYKLSNALINAITPIGKNQVLVTSFDGKVVCLEY
ncbi:MAG: PQQ-binding-like beta-propeller repeat protein [Bacteroidota bacterium]|nr:metallophosphoesterase [Odoribacter sp.]MDP3644161.1 PQQ-binding-like beta-propeller repeat protein [Bacteroidota bacterium]